jgi:thioredoxin-related protein
MCRNASDVLNRIALFAAALAAGASATFAGEVRLVFVEQPGCAYCMAWDDQIAPAYPDTAEGRFAPLVRADLHLGPPDGIDYTRKPRLTPTFILVEDGTEIARMEGYVGEDFFWPVYSRFLAEHTDFDATENRDGER